QCCWRGTEMAAYPEPTNSGTRRQKRARSKPRAGELGCASPKASRTLLETSLALGGRLSKRFRPARSLAVRLAAVGWVAGRFEAVAGSKDELPVAHADLVAEAERLRLGEAAAVQERAVLGGDIV